MDYKRIEPYLQFSVLLSLLLPINNAKAKLATYACFLNVKLCSFFPDVPISGRIGLFTFAVAACKGKNFSRKWLLNWRVYCTLAKINRNHPKNKTNAQLTSEKKWSLHMHEIMDH